MLSWHETSLCTSSKEIPLYDLSPREDEGSLMMTIAENSSQEELDQLHNNDNLDHNLVPITSVLKYKNKQVSIN
jgi:hypothetical protein